MGIDLIRDKEQLMNAVLKVLEGKEAKATLNLDGVHIHLGTSSVELNGKVQMTFIPGEPAKKKK
ncbi:MAG: hypothetical protein HY519_01115 [Candidatus Aenigmarchaeota archaeon]|nr:hypothetical protein [Candidatus Aenigmarchaeota archaeon]